MQIGIDAYEANINNRVGIGQYAYQVINQLYQLDHVNTYTLFLPTAPLSDLPIPRERWQYRIGRPGALWTVRQLPGLIAQEKLDLFFSPTHYAPWFTSLPKFIAIMDLSYLHYPDLFRKKDLWQLRFMTRYSLNRAHRVFTISNFSQAEINKYYNFPKSNIIVTYPGLNPKFYKQKYLNKSAQIKSEFGITGDYILFVGTLQPRKNLVRFIRAFEMLTKPNLQLVIVGKQGWLYDDIYAAAHRSPKADNIQFLNFVTDEELPQLYQGATCLVLPSLYEGFGIPAMEAMYFGCPVILSNTSSLPEIGADAAIYVDPFSEGDIANGITRVLQLSGTQREGMIKKGKLQVQKYTWETCAKKVHVAFSVLVA